MTQKRYVAQRIGEIRNAYDIFVIKLKRPFERSKREVENNTKMNLEKTEFENVDWIRMANDGDRWRVS